MSRNYSAIITRSSHSVFPPTKPSSTRTMTTRHPRLHPGRQDAISGFVNAAEVPRLLFPV
jgi:hypothetical protein